MLGKATKKPAYYNEFEPCCAQWLRNLIAAGHIPSGEVDERDIREVSGDDLREYGQVHLFAGLGGWAYAARLAGIEAERPIWTASCPCPPFSVAGQKKKCPSCVSDLLVPCPRRTGYFICADCGHAWLADARHLWPEAWRLISERRPGWVFGEQVDGEDGRLWLSGVRASLEILGYDVGSPGLPASCVGAPHVRQRLWWVADAGGRWIQSSRPSVDRAPAKTESSADKRQWLRPDARDGSITGRMGFTNRTRSFSRQQTTEAARHWDSAVATSCADGRSRRIGPGIQPLADGIPNRMGKLRAAGNAIVPQVAAEFMMAAIETRP